MKIMGKCNQLVVGSNPTPGALKNMANLSRIFLYPWAGFEPIFQNAEKNDNI